MTGGFGFIRGEDGNTYFVHRSKLNGEHIDRGYYVFFKPFQNDRSDYNAKNITVINAPEKRAGTTIFSKKKRHRRHKSCNADKVITEDKKFKRFVKTFLEQQRKEKKAWQNT